MKPMKHMIAVTSLSLIATMAVPTSAHAIIFGSKKKDVVQGKKLTPAQSALVDKAIAREKVVIKTIKERAPLVETYIQNMKPDPVMRQVPESDEHYLGRVDFGRVIDGKAYEEGPKAGKQPGKLSGIFHGSTSFLGGLGSSLHLKFQEGGFISMILMDSNNFDRQTYNFYFVRNDFLGNVRTSVFDVNPTGKPYGRFLGRIWIETQTGNVVRFDGDFAGTEKDYKDFYHFDSWRTNIQPDLWLPTSFYVEESDPKSQTSTLKFKAINHVWGYSLKVPTSTSSDDTEMTVVGAQDDTNTDVGPRQAQELFRKQAEDNVIERFFQAGLLDAPSDFDHTLEALANNILAYNNIAVSSPIRVRTMLTEPLESLAVGNTIILSKSLIDTTAVITSDGAQQMGNLNALLAFQLAHILSGHRLDTKYAFQDRMLFPDSASFKRIPMHHTDADNQEAAKKTLDLLSVKELNDGQKYFGLYLQQLGARIKGLKALNEPLLGDALVKSDTDTSFWLQAMVPKSEKLDQKNLKQEAAEPLSSYLRRDPWTDQLVTLHAAIEPILSPSDKMPFEVTPVYIKLSYYKEPVAPQPPPPAPAADQTAPLATPAPAADQTAPGTAPAAAPADQQPATPAPATPAPATQPQTPSPTN